MKKISLALILLIGAISCKPKSEVVDQSYYYEQIINDMSAQLQVANDSIACLNNIISAKDSAYIQSLNSLHNCDSANTALRSELFVANYKLGRIKEYCNIVKRNNSQLQFLRGWIVRVLDE